eukprot:scaffold11355_cov59-Phaeocystis_antarctica.AAC.3
MACLVPATAGQQWHRRHWHATGAAQALGRASRAGRAAQQAVAREGGTLSMSCCSAGPVNSSSHKASWSLCLTALALGLGVGVGVGVGLGLGLGLAYGLLIALPHWLTLRVRFMVRVRVRVRVRVSASWSFCLTAAGRALCMIALGIGHWTLRIGHWALGIGHWALALAVVVGARVGRSANVARAGSATVRTDCREAVGSSLRRRGCTVEGRVGQVGWVEPMREPSRGMRQ